MAQNFVACNKPDFQISAYNAGGNYPSSELLGIAGSKPGSIGSSAIYTGPEESDRGIAVKAQGDANYTKGVNMGSYNGVAITAPGGANCTTVANVGPYNATVAGVMGQGGICYPEDKNVRTPGMAPERLVLVLKLIHCISCLVILHAVVVIVSHLQSHDKL